MEEDELVGLAQAAVEVNLSRERLRQLIHAGKITGAKRIGNTLGIPQSEVDRLKREPRPKPGPKGPRRPKVVEYRQAGEHATGRVLRAAERQSDYTV